MEQSYNLHGQNVNGKIMKPGEKLRAWMEANGVSKTQLAETTGVPRENISRYASCAVGVPEFFALLMAGVVENQEDANYWLNLGASRDQARLLANGLGGQVPPKPEAALADAIEQVLMEWSTSGGAGLELFTTKSGKRGFTFRLKSDYNSSTPESEKKLLDRVARVLKAGDPVIINSLTNVLNSGEGLLRAGGTHDRDDAEGGGPKKQARGPRGNKR